MEVIPFAKAFIIVFPALASLLDEFLIGFIKLLTMLVPIEPILSASSLRSFIASPKLLKPSVTLSKLTCESLLMDDAIVAKPSVTVVILPELKALKALMPPASSFRSSPMPSGIVTPSHFLTESANLPNGSTKASRVTDPRYAQVKDFIPADKVVKLDFRSSETETPDHFLTAPAISPKGPTTADIDHPPTKAHVKDLTPAERFVKLVFKVSGTNTPDHFLTESANIPKGSATVDIDNAPKPSNENISTPPARLAN